VGSQGQKVKKVCGNLFEIWLHVESTAGFDVPGPLSLLMVININNKLILMVINIKDLIIIKILMNEIK
jgi:hypothetical protein